SLSIWAAAARPASMCLIAQIRSLITAVVVASYSPFGMAIDHEQSHGGHAGHLAISLFISRRTRVAASQQFDLAHRLNRDQIRRAEEKSPAVFIWAEASAGLLQSDKPVLPASA